MKMIDILKAKYPIQTWMWNPVLRQKSIEIIKLTKEILEFAEILNTLMWEYDWVWLAAPQIWENIRIISVTSWELKNKKHELLYDKIMINPEVIYRSKETDIQEEWCLSLPKQYAEIERPENIKVKHIDINWSVCIDVLSWLNARIVLHEIDHLDWILFLDKAINKQDTILKKIIF